MVKTLFVLAAGIGIGYFLNSSKGDEVIDELSAAVDRLKDAIDTGKNSVEKVGANLKKGAKDVASDLK